MKKTLLLILSIVCLSSLMVQAATTTNTATTANYSSAIRPNFEKMGPPPNGNFTARPIPMNGDFRGGQRPSKKPDSKPGGDRVPPEFIQSSNSSSTTSTK